MAAEDANKGAPNYPADVYPSGPYGGVDSNDELLSAVAAHTAEVEHSGGSSSAGAHGGTEASVSSSSEY